MNARLACLLMLVAVLPARAQDNKKALAELQGIWRFVKAESDNPAFESDPDLPRWVIKGDKVIYGGEEFAVLTVDPTATPKTIDLNLVKAKRVFEGVYAVDGDKLKICVNLQTDGAKNRPLDFATEGKRDRLLLLFERAKAGEPTNGSAGFVGIAIGMDADKKIVSIANLIPGSPAEKAGLKKDDILIKIGGGAATDVKTVVKLVQLATPGSDLTIRVQRGGKEQDIVVRVGVTPFFLLQ
jgi:uncharacterized protein (TIGR03067 family)